MSINCSHICIIYVKIYEKISSGGLEVSLSIVMCYKYIGLPIIIVLCYTHVWLPIIVVLCYK